MRKIKEAFFNFIKCYVIRCFSSPEKLMKYYLSKNHGSMKLHDGTWAVNQSDEFHKYCYDEAYKNWKKNSV